jgi:hypothetical protein
MKLLITDIDIAFEKILELELEGCAVQLLCSCRETARPDRTAVFASDGPK